MLNKITIVEQKYLKLFNFEQKKRVVARLKVDTY